LQLHVVEARALLNHAWSILAIPSVNREGIPKGIFSGALFKSECFKMWLPFAGPYKAMTHPVYFSTHLSCWQPTLLGTEAPLLSPFRLASGVASLAAPRRQGKRGLEAQPASERCLCEAALRGSVFSSLFWNHCYCCFSQLTRCFPPSASFSTWCKTI